MLGPLADTLLSIGGERVVVPHDHPEAAGFVLALVSTRGRSFDPATAVLEEGVTSDCHANTVRLWRDGRGAICTGFGLSPDGLWRSHSWLLATPGGHVVETTEPRTAYYGFEFDDEGAAIFAPTVDAG
ncbi:MAG TPA: hypothetical protein VIQ56_14000 [Gaiella sp.]